MPIEGAQETKTNPTQAYFDVNMEPASKQMKETTNENNKYRHKDLTWKP